MFLQIPRSRRNRIVGHAAGEVSRDAGDLSAATSFIMTLVSPCSVCRPCLRRTFPRRILVSASHATRHSSPAISPSCRDHTWREVRGIWNSARLDNRSAFRSSRMLSRSEGSSRPSPFLSYFTSRSARTFFGSGGGSSARMLDIRRGTGNAWSPVAGFLLAQEGSGNGDGKSWRGT